MKTIFPKKECHVPKWYVVDAQGKTLGRVATEISKLLRGKETSCCNFKCKSNKSFWKQRNN